MKRTIVSCIALLVTLLAVAPAAAQVGSFPRRTSSSTRPLWKGERFPDGRPKVPDDLLSRMKTVSIEEAWAVCRRHGFNNQFEGNWVTTHQDPVLAGRRVDRLLPTRPPRRE